MTNWLSSNVMANGLKLHYQRTGGEKPSLILCHGLTDHGRSWLRVAQALEKDYDLIMYDARGHGLSAAPEDGYGAEEHAADLIHLIQALALEKPHLIGHSMGAATVAMAIAHRPELVGRAVLEDPPFREADMVNRPDQERKTQAEEWHTSLVNRKTKSPEALAREVRELHPTWPEIEFDPWVEAKFQASPNIVKFITQTRTSWREVVAQITTPTLLVTGDVELGALITPEVAGEITRRQPNIELAHISGAGHSIHREQFERFIEVVTAFLGSR